MVAEEAVEVRGIVEAQRESNLLHRAAAGVELFFGIHHEHMVDEREGCVARSPFHGRAEVGLGHTARPGIVGHAVFACVVLGQQHDEFAADFLVAAHLFVPSGQMVAVEAGTRLEAERQEWGERLAVGFEPPEGVDVQEQPVGLFVEPDDAGRQGERRVLQDEVETVHYLLQVVRAAHELVREAGHVEMDVVADGVNLDEAVGQQRDEVACTDALFREIDGRLYLSAGTEDEQAGFDFAGKTSVGLQQRHGNLVGHYKLGRQVEFGKFGVGHRRNLNNRT